MVFKKRALYISCEGPTCSGKSTALETLVRSAPGLSIEVIGKRWPSQFDPTIDFFLEKDIDKYTRAKQSSARVVILDRGYLSTLVYYSVFEGGKHKNRVLRWLQAGYKSGRILQPSYYLYFDMEIGKIPERTLKRGRPLDPNNVWYHNPTEINMAYTHYFSSLECDVPVYRIDANKNPEEVVQEIETFLAKIQGDRNAQ